MLVTPGEERVKEGSTNTLSRPEVFKKKGIL